MKNTSETLFGRLLGKSFSYMGRFLLNILCVGPIPNHMAFILDGNRRYAKKWNLAEGMGHRAGFLTLMSLVKHCHGLGVKYITIYAFSIDNFRRRTEEVEYLMNLILEKIEELVKEESILKQYGVRLHFVGDLKLLNEPLRVAAQKAMEATSKNSKTILFICVAYTSTYEIVHAAQESCECKWIEIQSSKDEGSNSEISEGEKKDDCENGGIQLADVERHMYMRVAPDPDILVRSSGETRLSNFLLWQTSNCLLYSPEALWPEIGLRHLVWAVLNYQRLHPYLEKRMKHL